MNKTFNQYESNCRPIRLNKSNGTNALDLIGELIVKLTSAKALCVIRVLAAIACFFGFIGVIGGLEAGTISAGVAVVVSIFMVFIEILCFCPVKKK